MNDLSRNFRLAKLEGELGINLPQILMPKATFFYHPSIMLMFLLTTELSDFHHIILTQLDA
jgi:hypothetical protein